MTAPVNNQPSVFSSITGSFKDGYDWVINLSNNPTVKSTFESMDFLGKTPSNPKWLRPLTIGGAAASFATSLFLICKSKWLEKPLWLRRVTGVLLFVPVFYVVGYGIYNLFIKNSQWNQNRLFEKEKAENDGECASLFVDIQSKPAEEQYAAIVDFANKSNFNTAWTVSDTEYAVTFTVSKNNQVYSSKNAITENLFDVYRKLTIEEALKKDNELINDPEKTKPEIRQWFYTFVNDILKPLRLEVKDCTFPEDETTGECFIALSNYEHKICKNTRDCLAKEIKGWFSTAHSDQVSESLLNPSLDQ